MTVSHEVDNSASGVAKTYSDAATLSKLVDEAAELLERTAGVLNETMDGASGVHTIEAGSDILVRYDANTSRIELRTSGLVVDLEATSTIATIGVGSGSGIYNATAGFHADPSKSEIHYGEQNRVFADAGATYMRAGTSEVELIDGNPGTVQFTYGADCVDLESLVNFIILMANTINSQHGTTLDPLTIYC